MDGAVSSVSTVHFGVPLPVFVASQPAGANLLNRVDYDATVCRPGQVLENYRFGLVIGAPTIRGDAFQTPMSTVYGQLPPR